MGEKVDTCNDVNLLKRELLKFDEDVKDAVREFWDLVDADGNHKVDMEEYIELNCHLQHTVDPWSYDHEEARTIAIREWDFDSQGHDYLDGERFMMSFLQMADAWAPEISSRAYVEFLQMLLNMTTYVKDNGV